MEPHAVAKERISLRHPQTQFIYTLLTRFKMFHQIFLNLEFDKTVLTNTYIREKEWRKWRKFLWCRTLMYRWKLDGFGIKIPHDVSRLPILEVALIKASRLEIPQVWFNLEIFMRKTFWNFLEVFAGICRTIYEPSEDGRH